MTRATLARMVGPKRPGPAPLPVAEKMTAITLVKGTPEQRAALEAWAKREGRPLATLLREAGLRAARRSQP